MTNTLDKYDQPQSVDKRVRYFDGQFLHDQDFIDEQKYHLDRQRRPQRLLHSQGICEGLTVTLDDSSDPPLAMVTVGTAIDVQGRQIVLAEDRLVDVGTYRNQTVYLVIYYPEHEPSCDLADCGTPEDMRWWEQPVCDVIPDNETLLSHQIVLAKLQLSDSGSIDDINVNERQYAGVHLPSANATGPILRSGGDQAADLAVLTGDLLVEGDVTFTGNVTALEVEKQAGQVLLGDQDEDTVVIAGLLQSQHSSGYLQLDDALHVAEDLLVIGTTTLTGAATLSDTLSVAKTTTLTGAATLSDTLSVAKTTTLTGAATLSDTLSVAKTTTLTGAATLSDTLSVAKTTTLTGATSLGDTLSVAGTTTLTGATTLSDTLSVAGATTLIGAASLDDTLSVAGTTTLTGATTLSDTLSVAGATTLIGAASLDDTLSVAGTTTLTGATTLSDTLSVAGTTTLTGTASLDNNLSVAGTTTLTGAATLSNTLSVAGTTTLTGAASLDNMLSVAGTTTLTGAATLSDTLSVVGATTLDDSLTVSGTTALTDLRVSGNVGIGTTAPGASKLKIADIDSDAIDFEFVEAGAGQLTIVGSSKGWAMQTNTNGQHLYLNSGSSSQSNVLIGRTGREVVVQGQTGHVGIGTTAPGSSKLKIANSDSDSVNVSFPETGMGQLDIAGSSDGWKLQTKMEGKHLYLNREASASSDLYLGRRGKELSIRGSDGNVGIGQDQPIAKLEVNGDLKLQQGLAVNQFSNDGTLGGSSDQTVPTEQAVKTYVDLAVQGKPTVNFEAHDVKVYGNLTVEGNVIAKDTEHVQGNVNLGDEDADTITIYAAIPNSKIRTVKVSKSLYYRECQAR